MGPLEGPRQTGDENVRNEIGTGIYHGCKALNGVWVPRGVYIE